MIMVMQVFWTQVNYLTWEYFYTVVFVHLHKLGSEYLFHHC